MAADNKKSAGPPDFKHSFTVDETTRTDLNTMPSVTRLLNRKKLDLPSKPIDSADPLTPTTPVPPPIEEAPALSLEPSSESSESNITFSPPEIELEIPIPSGETHESSSSIIDSSVQPQLITRPAQVRSQPAGQLHYWDVRTLKSNRDPLAKGILQLLEKGAVSTLFMALVSPPPPGATVPHFLATAIAGESAKDKIWNGLKWDPSMVPNVWNSFIRPGFVELSPPGNMTDPISQRNILRGAFGVRMEEYFLLVRIGSETTCRGALVIISKNSFLEELQNVMEFFGESSSPIKKVA